MAFTRNPRKRTISNGKVHLYEWSDNTSISDVLRIIADDLESDDLLISLHYENAFENSRLWQGLTVVVEHG